MKFVCSIAALLVSSAEGAQRWESNSGCGGKVLGYERLVGFNTDAGCADFCTTAAKAHPGKGLCCGLATLTAPLYETCYLNDGYLQKPLKGGDRSFTFDAGQSPSLLMLVLLQ